MSKKNFNRKEFMNTQSKQEEQPVQEENQDQDEVLENEGTSQEQEVVQAVQTSEQTQQEALPENKEVSSPQVVEDTSQTEEAPKEVKHTKVNLKNIEARIVTKIESELTNYMEVMDPKKPIDPNVGAQWQYSLLQTMKSILNQPEFSVFAKEWTVLLNFFNKNKDEMFNENYMFRFPQNWTGSQTEFSQFRRLVFLAIQTADPKDRKKATSHMDMTKVTEGMTEAQASKLLNFYG